MQILQFSDSAFPVGGFSFSNGLETAVFEKIVHDAISLEEYTRTALQQVLYNDAIAALHAFRAAEQKCHEQLEVIDRKLLNCKLSAENRIMLTRMGKKMTDICIHLHPHPLLQRWQQYIQQQEEAGCYPIVQAIWFQLHGAIEQELLATLEYGTMNLILNAALRCMKISHYDTQAILYRLCRESESHYKEIHDWSLEDMQSFAPEMEIIASLHEKGKMRMFMN